MAEKQSNESTNLLSIRLLDFLGERGLSPDSLNLIRIVGFSNEVYKVDHKGKTYILKRKVEDKKTKKFVLYEETIKQIVKENSFGPQVYFEDQVMIIEEFIPGEVLTAQDVLSPFYILRSINQIALFNHLEIKQEYREKLNKESTAYQDLIKRGIFEDGLNIVQACMAITKDNTRLENLAVINDLLTNDSYRKRIDALAIKFNKNHVLGHNDFYRLNILKRNDQDELTLVDYEYAALNPIGWDLVNFFCERCLCYDEEKNKFGLDINLPRTSQRQVYFKYYLLAVSQLKNPESQLILDLSDDNMMQDLASDKYDKFLDTEIFNNLVEEFYSIMEVINFCWILWCTCLISEDQERWPVLDYTAKRVKLQEYLHSKSSPNKNILS